MCCFKVICLAGHPGFDVEIKESMTKSNNMKKTPSVKSALKMR